MLRDEFSLKEECGRLGDIERAVVPAPGKAARGTARPSLHLRSGRSGT
jgi:hypothetical protein